MLAHLSGKEDTSWSEFS